MAKILIIGGGVSGLSAGIYAQLNGHSAVVCEKHAVAGGNLTGWQRGEYHIDNCIHWLTGTNPASKSYKMWEDLGVLGDVEVLQGDSLFTHELNGQTLALYKDLDRLHREMLAISPEDSREINSLVRAIRIIQGINGIGGKHSNKGLAFGDALMCIPVLTKYYNMTTGQLAERFKHPLLKAFMTSFWGDSFGSFVLIMVCATFCGKNGGIPRGSSCAMAQRMADRFVSLGGELLLSKQAVKINHAGGRASSVTFADGATVEADYVVLAAEPAVAFKKLLGLPMPKKLGKIYGNARFRRFSSYQCAFSCDASDLPFEGDFMLPIPEEHRDLLLADQVAIREFSHERSFAPRGKNVVQTLTFCFEEHAKDFIALRDKDRELYKQKKKEIADALHKLIVQKFPQLQDKLKCIDVWTPATYRRYTNAEVGSYMSFALPEKVFPTRLSSRIRGLSNVLLATQWQWMPGGLPIAAECGQKTIQTIVRMERFRRSRKRVRV